MRENYFLTEFEKIPFIQKLIFSLNGFGLALFFFIFALCTAVLSFVSGTHCFWLQATDPTGVNKKTEIILMGYWGELNAAPFYVFIVPILIFLYCQFICSLHTTFNSLAREERLQSTSENEEVMKTLGEKNKAVFRRVVVIGLIFSILFVIGVELMTLFEVKTRLQSENPEKTVMGYVQRPYFDEWAEKVRTDKKIKKEIPTLKDKEGWNIEAKGGKGYAQTYFGIFLFFALVLQTLMVFLSFWVAFKIFYFFWETWNFLPKVSPNRRGTYGKIVPKFNDKEKRYGLSELDSIYRQILWLLIFVGVGLIANLSTNYTKGTFFSTNWLSSSGQILFFLSPMIIFIVFIFLPLLIYRNSMERVKEEALMKLNDEIKKTKKEIGEKEQVIEEKKKEKSGITHERSIAKIDGEIETLENKLKNLEDECEKKDDEKKILIAQVTYPQGDKIFLIQILLLVVLLILIPVTLILNVTTDRIKDTILGKPSTATAGTVDFTREILKSSCGCNEEKQ